MAFIEIQDQLSVITWLIFAANFFWVLGYDTIYAMVDIKDDLKIGIRTSAITFGIYLLPIICISYIIFAILLCYIAFLLHFNIFFWVLWLFAVFLLAYQIKSVNKRINLFHMFLLNNRVGYIIFIGILLSYYV